MNRIESEEVSNDDATIISELLNSAESMENSTTNTIEMSLQQKNELQLSSNSVEVPATFGDTTKPDKMSLPLAQSNSLSDCAHLNCSQYSESDGKEINIRHVHIPYILNGELYQIQTQDGENVTVKCCHCPPDRVYRGSVRSTGNFHMHIKRRHPDLLEKLHDMKVNALLERRDRLMRSRKISHRNNRNRIINTIANSSDMCSFKNEEKCKLNALPGTQLPLDSSMDSNLVHTHKLKIKTVFQKHQMQQREAAGIKNWKITDYVVSPTNEEYLQPINYSLKTQGNHEIMRMFSAHLPNTCEQMQKQQERIKPDNITTQTSLNNSKIVNNQPTNLANSSNTEQNKIVCQSHTNNNRYLSSSSTSTTCSSVMSNYSNTHQLEIDTNRPYSFSLQHHNLYIVKPEHLLVGGESQAIDLTVHSDSGVFSNSENNESSFNNNSDGSQQSNTIDTTNNNTEGNSDPKTTKWQDLLTQVGNSLRDIQHEMNVHNQIESNRMFLDIAKFKFLNPGFQFNW